MPSLVSIAIQLQSTNYVLYLLQSFFPKIILMLVKVIDS